MRNLMKFNRFVMPLLLIIFSALLHGCTLNENVSYKSAYADNNLSVKNENINGAIVKVNDKYIYHDEIFLQQFGKVGVSYSDIVENSIDEIVATSYAEKLGVFVSESEIDNAICEYEAINKEVYDKALKIYGETTLKQKLKDRLLFVSTKNKVLEQEVKIDANLIESFKSQKELHGELDKYSDSELMKRMNKEIKDYAFGLWVKEKRKESKIEYLKLYDKYKKDCLVFNDNQMSMPKIDAKEVALDGDEGKEILASLSIFEKYNPVSVYEILVKPNNKDDYTERAYIKVHLVNEDNNDNSEPNDDISLGDYRTEDDIPDYKLQEHNRSREGVAEEIPFSDAVSFYEILKEQLAMQDLTDEQREIAEYLIGSLDDDGLLRKSIESVMDELAIYRGIYTTENELNKILEIIQDFDPAGIGARNLQECLLIQINRKADSPLKQIELDIIGKCCDEFTRKNKDKIIQKLGITEEQYNEALAELTKLNPRPGSSLGEAMGRNFQQIIPDFIVETFDDGTITLNLNNRNVPELRLSREFTELLDEHTRNKENQSKESKDALMFLKQKVDAAQGFINAVKQRQHTLLTTMQTIIDIQRPFFLEGDESLLKPMILKDVAERAKLDISTISRVSNSKYVQTNYGIYSLKFFFSDGYTTEDGEELSVREIKRILKECVDNEDKEKPYTDDELAEILKAKGYPIARRTVAKYRQQLNIPVARLRR